MKRIVFLIVTVILLSCSVDHETERILSHVSELKNRIDNQIVVRKEKSGGSTAEIIPA